VFVVFTEFVGFVEFVVFTGFDELVEVTSEKVGFIKGKVRLFFKPFKIFFFEHTRIIVNKTVNAYNLKAFPDQSFSKVGADKSCNAGDQNIHKNSFLKTG